MWEGLRELVVPSLMSFEGWVAKQSVTVFIRPRPSEVISQRIS
jgi:hypothetical protein